MPGAKVVHIGKHFVILKFQAVSDQDIALTSMQDRFQILSRIWILKNFNAQKFLGQCLSQNKALAEMLRLRIGLHARYAGSDATRLAWTLKQSIFCAFWSFMIISWDRFRRRNFHIYQHTQNPTYRRICNKMLKIWASTRYFDLYGFDARYRAYCAASLQIWDDIICQCGQCKLPSYRYGRNFWSVADRYPISQRLKNLFLHLNCLSHAKISHKTTIFCYCWEIGGKNETLGLLRCDCGPDWRNWRAGIGVPFLKNRYQRKQVSEPVCL